jgi:glycosyltransferase involved in cell wall biosynthesis
MNSSTQPEYMEREVVDSPVVSVIIPAYMAAPYIQETLQSVFAQTFEQFEVIIVNDGSPDTAEFEAVVAPFRSRVIYLKQENRGVSAARNRGLSLARGEYVAFLDSDDIWEPDYLEVQLGFLERDAQAAVVYPNARIFGLGPHVGKEYMDLCPSEGEVTFESLISQRCNVMVSVLVRRNALIKAGLFDETLRSSEDFDLWMRMVNSGERIIYHRQLLVRYRHHPDSLSSDDLWMFEHGLKVLEKARDTFKLNDAEALTLEDHIARFAAMKNLTEGKRAFDEGDTERAMGKLQAANSFLNTRKLNWVLLLLRHTPGALRRLHRIRQRYAIGRQN